MPVKNQFSPIASICQINGNKWQNLASNGKQWQAVAKNGKDFSI